MNQKVKYVEKEVRKRQRKIEDREGRIREVSGEIKWNNIHITGFPEETEEGCEDDLEQIIAENFHSW